MTESTQEAAQAEPPSSPANIYLVGQDSRGRWVVQDQRGLHGGLFIDRGNAIRFAMDETGKRPSAIKLVPGILELDMGGPVAAGAQARPSQAHPFIAIAA
jgi:hypothetical protein